MELSDSGGHEYRACHGVSAGCIDFVMGDSAVFFLGLLCGRGYSDQCLFGTLRVIHRSSPDCTAAFFVWLYQCFRVRRWQRPDCPVGQRSSGPIRTPARHFLCGRGLRNAAGRPAGSGCNPDGVPMAIAPPLATRLAVTRPGWPFDDVTDVEAKRFSPRTTATFSRWRSYAGATLRCHRGWLLLFWIGLYRIHDFYHLAAARVRLDQFESDVVLCKHGDRWYVGRSTLVEGPG